jgi:hypothetical protein
MIVLLCNTVITGELLGDAFEEFLDGGGVADEGGGHLDAPGWNVAHRGLHIVGNPLDKVGGVLVLHIQHLLVHLIMLKLKMPPQPMPPANLFHAHPASEDGGHG